MSRALTFFEFFAGGGLARLGLEATGAPWRCLFANDVDPRKAAVYRAHFRDNRDPYRIADVARLTAADLPRTDAPDGAADLAWASFPCQDLSLAGGRGGLGAPRSGTYWPFHRLMADLAAEGRAPRVIAIENVVGLLTSRDGADLAALVESLTAIGYGVDWQVVDAQNFLPQSRPRLFIVAVRGADGFRFLPPGERHEVRLESVLEDDPGSWDAPDVTAHILSLMNLRHRSRVEALRKSGVRRVGTLYRRTRMERGLKRQRAETRFDGVAGCLRTPAGGSSRQRVIDIARNQVRTRFVTPREAARLMGMPDAYPLPKGVGQALHLIGDGVAVPVVRWLAKEVIEDHVWADPSERAALRNRTAA